MFHSLFKSMVRPHLEYGQSIWSPSRKKDIEIIENVQRHVTKILPGMENVTYPEQLRKIDLQILVYRCQKGRYDSSPQATPLRIRWRGGHASSHEQQPDPAQLLQTEEGQMHQQEIPGHIQT